LKSNILSPFSLGPASIFTSLLGSKSATPTIEECKVRLARIGSEIQKAEIMYDSTTNGEVRLACRQRMLKLTDERRFYQIVQERHKIRTMLETTMVDSVRMACEERLQQLISELESLRASERDDGGARDASGGVSDYEDDGKEDGEWYDRVLKYVGGADEMQDRRSHGIPDGWAPHPIKGSWACQPLPPQGRHSHSNEESYPGSYHVWRGPGHEDDLGILSPRSDATRTGYRERGRVNGRPVAYAVKSRTSHF
jgi:hypothetical protein